ncbi:MAG TPA: zinc ribbon domain-containing protein [Gemmatimonadales bacterium]|jgi:putative FmdB family regulatory protein|nr:zinc ribbon domain-containing protein [Gemmatimonadales bacterium]
MPTYEYVCPAGHEFEKFQKMTDKPRAKCPVCGKPAIRQISGGAGLVFRGSGFYITDYGKDGKGPRKAPEGEKGGEASTAKSDTSDTKDSSTPAKAEPKASETKSKAKKAAE